MNSGNKAKAIILGTILLLFIIILLQNTHEITLNVLFWEINTSTFYIPVVIIISAVIGFYIAKAIEKKKKKRNDEML